MKVVILTDSLGLPRTFPEVVKLEETYIEKLRDRYRDIRFITLSIGGARLATLQQQYFNYFQSVEPDLVILQSGIVDAAPRALKGWEATVINSNVISRKLYSFFLKPHTVFIRKVRKLTYTPLPGFTYLASTFRRAMGTKVAWIGIIPANSEYEANLPGIGKNIESYNQQLKMIFSDEFIDMSDMPADGVMSDHHHINKKGHEFIFEKVSRLINMLRKES
ncbi:SGNH/GDSL hydrolase family protein [Chitinophaga polysaccharea]|uniref:SGNH/GDSL hydrolase family protein n=1 Tax=Chitinophaga polysaccharea TaxID=1293035 RepID=UPI0014558B15|nr:SGNH/GDSL hydrolase family protein [Chitinophaga polysaccharea]NLR61859.1 SGNH/GDSL hydrolase family protein [Chitinophaga polysaccharea]